MTAAEKAVAYREGLEGMLGAMFPEGVPAEGEPTSILYMASEEAAYRLKVGRVMAQLVAAVEESDSVADFRTRVGLEEEGGSDV